VAQARPANLRFRLNLLLLCKGSRRRQAAIKEACRQDVLFYVNTFVFQFNPNKKGMESVMPFIAWDFQERALVGRPETTGTRGILWCYEHDRSAVIEKSRKMGATWLFLIVQDWVALFHPYFQSLNISRSAEAVDDKSPNSLFWKMRYMHENLPDWLKGTWSRRRCTSATTTPAPTSPGRPVPDGPASAGGRA
jgi:hypothetical protein